MAQYAYVVARNTRAGIQEEIDKAHAEGGGLVFLPRGVYTLDGPLCLKANVHLTGVGAQSLLTVDPALGAAAAEMNVIELDGGDEPLPQDIEISKLAIRGPSKSPDISEAAASVIGKGCGIVALQVDVRNVVVRACRIENVGGCGILFYSQRADHHLEGVTIKDCYLHQNRRPDEEGMPSNYKDIYFYGAHFEHVRVEGNVCTFAPNASSQYGNDSGIAFVGNGRGGYVRHTWLTGNFCSGHRRHGLITGYGKMEQDAVFASGNRCENNGWVGLYVSSSFNYMEEEGVAVSGKFGVVVSGNFCNHNGFWGDKPGSRDTSIRGGIVLNGAYHTVVTNNVCMYNGVPAPAFAKMGGVAEAEADKVAAANAAGIRVRGAENIIDGNLLKGNQNAGIRMWPGQVSHTSITNNRAVDNRGQGIVLAGLDSAKAQKIVVTGNVCAENKDYGIQGFHTDGALVASNYVFDNEKVGVRMENNTQGVQVETNFIDPKLTAKPTPPSEPPPSEPPPEKPKKWKKW